jgi:hypothetical protein
VGGVTNVCSGSTGASSTVGLLFLAAGSGGSAGGAMTLSGGSSATAVAMSLSGGPGSAGVGCAVFVQAGLGTNSAGALQSQHRVTRRQEEAYQ